jgi:Lrp/AsnC family transcriptional regulator
LIDLALNIENIPLYALYAGRNKNNVARCAATWAICSVFDGEKEMSVRIDDTDRKILMELQRDAGQSLDEIARKVGASKTPVWNRIRKMREGGIMGAQAVVLDAEKLGFDACFFVLIRTSEHEADWQAKFLKALRDRPEVQEAHRLAGDIDYILKVRVKNARAYDVFYQSLISEVKVHNVTALLSMEEIKSTTALPL